MAYPCDFYGISMAYPCNFYGISMAYPCDFYGISMVYPWHIHVISMAYPCDIHGIPVVYFVTYITGLETSQRYNWLIKLVIHVKRPLPSGNPPIQVGDQSFTKWSSQYLGGVILLHLHPQNQKKKTAQFPAPYDSRKHRRGQLKLLRDAMTYRRCR